MKLIERFELSWELMKRSFRVMRDHPRLLLFPLVIGALTLLIVGFFIAVPLLSFALQDTGHAWNQGAHWNIVTAQWRHFRQMQEGSITISTIVALAGVLLYFVSMVLATFCNVAFYNEIIKALAGDPVSLRAGFRFAATRIKSILAWSLFAASVGLIIEMLSERLGFLGAWVLRLVGTVWSVACVFVVPLMIRNGTTNPLQLLRGSTSLLKKTWGESLLGYVGFSLVSIAVVMACLLGILTTILVSAFVLENAGWGTVVVCCLFLILAGTLGYLVHVADKIFRCALYVYASEGVIPEPFTAEMLDSAWKVKPSARPV